jgi:hypothetical protein
MSPAWKRQMILNGLITALIFAGWGIYRWLH